MPTYNVTVDDSSPMVIYSPGWVDSNKSDPQLSNYFGATSHTTSLSGATASISFFGDAVYLFGTMRPDYGPFNVTLDGKATSHSAMTSNNTDFQQVLFSAPTLSSKTHELVLTNTGNETYVDIDFITFTTGDGDGSVKHTSSSIDDSSSLITYAPTSAWQTTSSSSSSYFNSTLHISQLQGSQATVPFTGNAVSLYGATNKSHGTFTLKVDDQPSVSLNGSAPSFRPQTLLYWVGGLHYERHTVTITNTLDTFSLDLDEVVVTSWISTSVEPPTSVKHISVSNIPVIAGVISGACVLLAWTVALFLLLLRRHRRRHQDHPLHNAKKPFILPPDPAIVRGSHEPHTFLFGKEAKTLPPHLSDTVPTGTLSTTIVPSTHTQSEDVESLSHRHMNPSTSSSIAVASTSAFEVQADSDRRGVVCVTDKVET